MPYHSPSPALRISSRGQAMIRNFEGCARARRDGRFDAYPDPASGDAPWTIGWGSTGPGIGKGAIWTQAQCDARLASDLEHIADGLNRLMSGAPTGQSQFDALACLAYNIGTNRLGRSTLLRLHKGGDHAGAAAQFARWAYAGGQMQPGLAARRAAEARLYASPDGHPAR